MPAAAQTTTLEVLMRNSDSDLVDCLIIGGGAAGLAAAIYLGRFRRNVLVVDSGESRLALIPVSPRT